MEQLKTSFEQYWSVLPPPKASDKVKVSIKAYREDVHRSYTGKSNRDVLRNFREIYDHASAKLTSETVLIPGLVDLDEVERIAEFVASIDPTIPLRINAYRPVAPGTPWRSPTREEVLRAANVARKHLNNAELLSGEEATIGKVYSPWH